MPRKNVEKLMKMTKILRNDEQIMKILKIKENNEIKMLPVF